MTSSSSSTIPSADVSALLALSQPAEPSQSAGSSSSSSLGNRHVTVVSSSSPIAATVVKASIVSPFSQEAIDLMAVPLITKISELDKLASTQQIELDAAANALEKAKSAFNSTMELVGKLRGALSVLRGESSSSSQVEVGSKRTQQSKDDQSKKRIKLEDGSSRSSALSEPDLALVAEFLDFGQTNVFYKKTPKEMATILGFEKQSNQFTISKDVKVNEEELIYMPKEGETCLLKDEIDDDDQRYYVVTIEKVLRTPSTRFKKLQIEIKWAGYDSTATRTVTQLSTLLPLVGKEEILDKLKSSFVEAHDDKYKVGRGYTLKLLEKEV